MSTNGLKSSMKHPYQLQKEANSPEPIEWITVSPSWIMKYGGAIERQKLINKLKK